MLLKDVVSLEENGVIALRLCTFGRLIRFATSG